MYAGGRVLTSTQPVGWLYVHAVQHLRTMWGRSRWSGVVPYHLLTPNS